MATYFLAKSRSTAISGLEIAGLLGTKIITPRTFLTRVRYGDTIINWGRSFPVADYFTKALRWWNPTWAVAVSGNKLKTLQYLRASDVSSLEFTTAKEEAVGWGCRVFARHLLRGAGGRGIDIVLPDEPVPDAPLYTKGFPKDREYRVHAGRGQAFFIQQKRLVREERRPLGHTPGIRNYANGWIFACKDIDDPPEGIEDLAARAVAACGLDFGAVDVLVDKNNNAVVCEVNSAPGVDGSTVDAYVSFFRSIL